MSSGMFKRMYIATDPGRDFRRACRARHGHQTIHSTTGEFNSPKTNFYADCALRRRRASRAPCTAHDAADAPSKLTPGVRIWPDNVFSQGNVNISLTGNYSFSQLDEAGPRPMEVHAAGSLVETRSGADANFNVRTPPPSPSNTIAIQL